MKRSAGGIVRKGLLEPAVGFLVAVAFWPGIYGSATSPRWAIAAISLWFLDWYVLPFIAVCFAALEFDAACHWAIVSAAFFWGLNGSARQQVRRLHDHGLAVVAGYAIGIACSGALAFCQKTLGYEGIYQIAAPAGLFLNKNLMGEAACLALIAALCMRKWSLALLALPALILSTSRASMLAVMVGLIVMTHGLLRYLLLSALLLLGLSAYSAGLLDSTTLVQRLYMWQQAIEQLTWLGNGSYHLVAPTWTETHLHNDWLQAAFELGLVGIAPLAVILAAGTSETYRPFISALFVIGCFGFPLQAPTTAWLGAFIVGTALRDVLAQRGVLLPARLDNAQSRRSVRRTADLSFPILR